MQDTEDARDKGLLPKYYVGIGASAGGLEALQDFFKNLPDDMDAAYLVIQHLAPDYKSMMNELLARFTKLAIKKITDGLLVEANTIYLIPPSHNLTIYHGSLYLQPYNPQRSFNLPVDVFLRSLANDQEKQAIAVILSGTGSDGTLGVKAIKEMGGMVIVQEEESAKFNGMPRNAIATGLADYILPPAKMGEAIRTYIGHPLITSATKKDEQMADLNLDAMAKILLMLRDTSGIDFSFYKENTIARRVERRIGIKRMESIEEYLAYLMDSVGEKDVLCKELLIGVTRFFRDAEAFASLREKVFPSLLKQGAVVRIWSTGCSTGEEVYSLAIECLNYMKQHNLHCDLKIFATDVDKHALEIASQGYYPSNIAADMESNLLATYFTRQEEGYQILDEVRRLIVFAVHNILRDPPFSRLDFVVCRNLFIYLKPDVQQQVLSTFFYALNTEGYLFMGSSESIGEMSEAFRSIDLKWKLYRKDASYKPKQVLSSLPLPSTSAESLSNRGSGQVLVKGRAFERLLESALSLVLPPSVIIDEHDNIIHVINNMNMFMEIRPGRFSQNLLGNLPQDLGLFVNNVIRRLKDGDSEIQFENITGIPRFSGKRITITGRVLHLENRTFYQLSFDSQAELGTRKPEDKATTVSIEEQVGSRIQELERSLQLTKENLQATVEELETSNEELQSSNEELIASNEELQSTNEELQALNEELYSVNAEYQQKIDELVRTTGDLDNLIKNAEVGALYLDKTLCIRRVTPAISKVANIFSTDMGRPISHFTFRGNTEALMHDIQQVVETLQPLEQEMSDQEGKTWLVRVRPYRTAHNAVDGIIIVFFDITKIKEQEEQNKVVLQRMEEAMRLGQMAWWLWDLSKDVFEYDPMLIQMLGLRGLELPFNLETFLALVHPDDRKRCEEVFSDLQYGRYENKEFVLRLQACDGSYLSFSCHANAGEQQNKRIPSRLFGTLSNITRIKALELDLMTSSENFAQLAAWNPQPQVVVDGNGLIVFLSEDAALLWGQNPMVLVGKPFDSLFVLDSSKAEPGPFAQLRAGETSEKAAFLLLRPGSDSPVSVSVQGFLPASGGKKQFLFFLHAEQGGEGT